MNFEILRKTLVISGGLVLGLTIALNAIGLINAFSSADKAIAILLLLVAIAFSCYRSTYRRSRQSEFQTYAIAGGSLGISVLCFVFAVNGGMAAAILAVWFSSFTLFRLIQSTEMWTRCASIATAIAMLLWVALDGPASAWLKQTAATYSAWLASTLLDVFAIPHLREPTQLVSLNATLDFIPSAESIFGVLPLLAAVCLVVMSGRKSLFQALMMTLGGVLTWSCVQGISGWWTISSMPLTDASTELTLLSVPVLWSLLSILASLCSIILVEALTDYIPLERTDWDYPVATYFWNFFARFPASLTNELAGRS